MIFRSRVFLIKIILELTQVVLYTYQNKMSDTGSAK